MPKASSTPEPEERVVAPPDPRHGLAPELEPKPDFVTCPYCKRQGTKKWFSFHKIICGRAA